MELSYLLVVWFLYLAVVEITGGEGAFISRDRVRFLKEPKDQVAIIGSPVEIPCSVTCGASRCLLFVTWTKNGTLVTFSDRVYKNSLGSLIFKGVGAEDEGSYQCVVISPSYGVFLSPRGGLKIAKIGEWEQDADDVVDVIPGGAVRLDCIVETAIPKPNVTWYHNGTTLVGDPLDRRRKMLPQGVLQISRVLHSDAGIYSCIAANIAGTISGRNATLNVSQAASGEILEVVYAPRSITVVHGQQAVFECLVQLAENILWKRIDESPLSLEAYVSGGNLIIPNVSIADAGTYGCIAQNRDRSITLQANLTVHWSPTIVKAPVETRRLRGESWRLNCYTDANPSPEITWYRNGERLRSHGRMKMFPNELQAPSILEKPSGGIEYVRDLLITSIEKDDAGVYQCFAENYLGSSTAAAAMIYQETVELDAPFNVTATVLPDQRELEISWHLPPLDFGNRSVVFIIHFHESETGSENTMAVKYDSCKSDVCKAICCTNINLVPYTNYTFWVDALLDYNQTPPKFTKPSERIIVRTGDAAVSAGAPLLLQETPEVDTILLSWQKPSAAPVKGEIVGYRIEMKTQSKPGSRQLVWWRQPTVLPPSTTTYTVRNVKPGYILYFRVVASTRAGYPSVYSMADFPLLRYHANKTTIPDQNSTESYLEEAPIIDARGLNSSTISVKWAQSTARTKRSESQVSIKWIVSASTSVDGSPLTHTDVPYQESSVILSGLSPDTTYQITVHELKSSGMEGLRAITLARTDASDLADGDPPSNGLARIVVPYPIPYCEPAGPGKLRVKWEKPPMSITGVTLRYTLLPTDLNEPLNVSAYVKTVETSSDSMLFTDLLPGRVYLFAARAHTEYGYKSVYSQDVNCSVPLARLEAPPRVEAVVVNGSVVVWWVPVTPVNGADTVISYHVRYGTNSAEEYTWKEIIVPGTDTTITLTSQNSSIYFVSVAAEGAAGRGLESPMKIVGTDPSASDDLIALHASYSSSSTPGDASGATVILQVSYKEGILIGVLVGIICASVSAIILIIRSRRDCIHRLLFCHKRSALKNNGSGCYLSERQDGHVRCVELKEMQTLLPELMENAESDTKGANNGPRNHESANTTSNSPSENEGDRKSMRLTQSQWSQEALVPNGKNTENRAPRRTRVAPAELGTSMNSDGQHGEMEGDWRNVHRSFTSSLPNLLEKQLGSRL